MNFPPFGGHFSTTLPTIHQFAAKFSQDTSPASSSTAPSLCSTQEATNNSRYTANGVPSFTQHHHVTQPQVLTALNTAKCQSGYVNHGLYSQQRPSEKRPGVYEPQELAQELCAVMLQQNHHHHQQEKQQEKGKPELQIPERRPHQSSQQPHLPNQLPPAGPESQNAVPATTSTTPWQSLTNTNSTVVDYLSQLPTSTLPLSLHHFLKYSAENLKKENAPHMQNVDGLNLLHNGGLNVASNVSLSNNVGHNGISNLTSLTTINAAQLQGNSLVKKKKKKKPEKEKKPKPKPGEIRLTTALDGSTLYCCPECHMAYPEKELLEQHLLGHTMERRFVCDICGAGLKRKDHLTRHKQSHNPERPYVCSVCLKAFKRKEQLTLHFVIHSGEKRHVCAECGKGFYRKDHLRKHTRSHIARRVKAELSQQGATSQALQIQVPAPTANNSSSSNILS